MCGPLPFEAAIRAHLPGASGWLAQDMTPARDNYRDEMAKLEGLISGIKAGPEAAAAA